MLSLIFLGGYLVLFVWGLVLGLHGKANADWPTGNEDAQTLLSSIGGLAAVFFTVALNLPGKDPPRVRAARVLGFVRAPDWKGIDRKVLVVLGTLLVILFPLLTLAGFAETIWRTDSTPGFIAKFAGPGIGILVTAVTVSASRLTRPPS
jgi:hypothetical protein